MRQGVTDREEFPMPPSDVVFLFDVDNTLLDNDRVTEDLQRYLEREVGPERQERYWTIFIMTRFRGGCAGIEWRPQMGPQGLNPLPRPRSFSHPTKRTKSMALPGSCWVK